MSASSEIDGIGTKKRINRSILDQDVGLCSFCGHKITLCGIPFTADIECNKCHTINHFMNSKLPVQVATVDSNG